MENELTNLRLGKVIAIVEDDAEMRAMLQEFLSLHGFEVHAFPCAVRFLEAFRADNSPYRLVICDVYTRGPNGLDLLREARGSVPGLSFLLMTAAPTAGDERSARNLGAQAYLCKPFRLTELLIHAQKGELETAAASAAG
jgi:DNA-binding response OmpR family regulator